MGDHSISTSRRKLMQGASLGVASAMIGSTLAGAQPEDSVGAARQAEPLKDPRQGYPHPPFKEQSQPWPGLTGKMTPRPDHGESSYRGCGKLLGRRALITGGDSGIGRAVAIAFAREGADVAISYLPAEEPDAKEVIALIQQAGRKGLALPGDIRDEAVCQGLVSRVIAAFGGIDLLVNNAARQHSAESILDIATDAFDWTLKTNLYAMFWITKAAVAHMPPGSAIINTASVNAYDPSENLLDYSLTKGGIVAFTKGLAKQMIKRGIRVNGVAPGPFWTPLQVSGGQTQENLKAFGAATPMGRPGQPSEIAHVYVQLAGADSSYVTGQIYGQSGGRGQP